MKKGNTFVFIIVAACVLILGGIFYLNYNKMEPVVQSARDADFLNSQNIIAKVNAQRSEKGLTSFVSDSSLTLEAKKSAESFGGVRFATLHDDYYSAEDYLKDNPVSETGSRIGAWVSYVLEKTGEKPVAYVVVIIK